MPELLVSADHPTYLVGSHALTVTISDLALELLFESVGPEKFPCISDTHYWILVTNAVGDSILLHVSHICEKLVSGSIVRVVRQ